MPFCAWTAHTNKSCRAWHSIMALGPHTRSDEVRYYMPSSTLDCKHRWTMSDVACHNGPWTAHMVRRHRAWHAIISPRMYIQFNDIERGMPSYPFDITHDRTTSVVARHNKSWIAHTIKRCREWHVCIALAYHT